MTFTQGIANSAIPFKRYGNHHVYCNGKNDSFERMPKVWERHVIPSWINEIGARVTQEIWYNGFLNDRVRYQQAIGYG